MFPSQQAAIARLQQVQHRRKTETLDAALKAVYQLGDEDDERGNYQRDQELALAVLLPPVDDAELCTWEWFQELGMQSAESHADCLQVAYPTPVGQSHHYERDVRVWRGGRVTVCDSEEHFTVMDWTKLPRGIFRAFLTGLQVPTTETK